MSVPMSRASTWSTPIASGMSLPVRAHRTNGTSSATLSVRWNVRKRRMLAKVPRPSWTALGIVAKLSSPNSFMHTASVQKVTGGLLMCGP